MRKASRMRLPKSNFSLRRMSLCWPRPWEAELAEFPWASQPGRMPSTCGCTKGIMCVYICTLIFLYRRYVFFYIDMILKCCRIRLIQYRPIASRQWKDIEDDVKMKNRTQRSDSRSRAFWIDVFHISSIFLQHLAARLLTFSHDMSAGPCFLPAPIITNPRHKQTQSMVFYLDCPFSLGVPSPNP